MILGCEELFSCFWIMILPTVFFTANPAPTSSTACTYMEFTVEIKAT
jgi:hypothetical protein